MRRDLVLERRHGDRHRLDDPPELRIEAAHAIPQRVVEARRARALLPFGQRVANERVTIVAEYGQIVQRGDSAFLIMRDGNVERRRTKERDPTIVVLGTDLLTLTVT